MTLARCRGLCSGTRQMPDPSLIVRVTAEARARAMKGSKMRPYSSGTMPSAVPGKGDVACTGRMACSGTQYDSKPRSSACLASTAESTDVLVWKTKMPTFMVFRSLWCCAGRQYIATPCPAAGPAAPPAAGYQRDSQVRHRFRRRPRRRLPKQAFPALLAKIFELLAGEAKIIPGNAAERGNSPRRCRTSGRYSRGDRCCATPSPYTSPGSRRTTWVLKPVPLHACGSLT